MVLFELSNWNQFRSYCERGYQGHYSFKNVPEGNELRISCGKHCFIRVFDPIEERSEAQKEIYEEMTKFCETQGFYFIEGTQDEEYFHA